MEKLILDPIAQHLFDGRMVQMSGQVGSDLAKYVNRQLLAMERLDAKTPIVVLIDSPGGAIHSGFGIYDMIQFVAPPVVTLVTGLAASMGSLIALSAKKENRLAFPNSKFLIHQPLISGSIQGQASDIEIHAIDIVKTKEKINRLYSKETGRSYEEICDRTDRDHWLDAKEALELGLISKIINSRAELDAHLKQL